MTVLLVAALMFTLAFTVVSTSFFHLNFSSRLSNQAQAKNLAESALSLGITKLLASHEHDQARYKPEAGMQFFPQYPQFQHT